MTPTKKSLPVTQYRRAAPALVKPLAEYRPDPSRSIVLRGEIKQDLVYELTPKILKLRHESPGPITVYIDSPGGSVLHAKQITTLLRAPSLEHPGTPHLITVATTRAMSAAAVILSSGNYAIAYPNSRIHFHGVRMFRDDAITLEKASDVAKDLKESNSLSARELARNCRRRFFFRYVSIRKEFEQYRIDNPGVLSEKDCFRGLISQKLSPLGLEVLKKADIRMGRYVSLSATIFKRPTISKILASIVTEMAAKRPVFTLYRNLEADMLKAIIAFEIKANSANPSWNFSIGGLAQVSDDFLLLNEYIGHHQNDWIEDFCEQWKDFVLDDGDKAEIEKLPEDERNAARKNKLHPVLLPLWLYLGAICHVLQEAENLLMPLDAFWLGLIDDVVGEDLPTLRKIAEMSPITT